MNPRKSGAASALFLAIFAGFVAAASSGIATVAQAPAPAVAPAPPHADPVAPLLAFVASGKRDAVFAARAEFAKHVAALAAVARDDDDARQAEAIAALGVAGTPEALEALRSIESHGSPIDAQLARVAMGESLAPLP